jgi:hypothetical protein
VLEVYCQPVLPGHDCPYIRVASLRPVMMVLPFFGSRSIRVSNLT